MQYKGVVFDFNGTLFWDTPLHNKAWNLFLDQYGIRLSDEDFFTRIHGRNNRDLLDELFGRVHTDEEVQRFIDEKEAVYRRFCLESGLSLAPGLTDFLGYLQQCEIPFTIATASGKENLDFYFEHLDIARWFDYNRVVYNNGKIKSKPDPDIYLRAMRMIGVEPRDTVVFEDAIAGLQAARNAGAGLIIAVDSNNDDYSAWADCQVIGSFDEVDRVCLFG